MTLYVKNRLVQAAMAGWSDGPFCLSAAEAGAGMVTLGGFNADDATYRAAFAASKRRREFLVPPGQLERRIKKYAAEIRPTGAVICLNLRFAQPNAIGELCSAVRESVDLVELNAHCRQPEFVSAGSGEGLLGDPGRMLEAVTIASSHIPTTVKLRARKMVPELPGMIEDSGGVGLHLDLMVPGEQRADLELLGRVRNSTDLMIIGNNSVADERSFEDMLGAGANLASIARALLGDPGVIHRILASSDCISAMGPPTPSGHRLL